MCVGGSRGERGARLVGMVSRVVCEDRKGEAGGIISVLVGM